MEIIYLLILLSATAIYIIFRINKISAHRNKALKQLALLLMLAPLTSYATFTATQSSTWTDASRAVDGNTDGNWYNDSVSLTYSNYHSWLLIDIGSVQHIKSLTLWNRTDAYSDALQGVKVMLSETPFSPDASTTGYDNALAQSIWAESVSTSTQNVASIPFTNINKKARYILIQKAGVGSAPSGNYYLAMAEVTVETQAIPVAEYRLDECEWSGASSEILDNAGSVNGQSFNDAQIDKTDSKICNSGAFFGTDSDRNTYNGDYLSMGDNFNNIFGTSSNQFTLTTWIKPASLGTTTSNHGTANTIIAKSSVPKNDNIELGINPDGSVRLYLDTRNVDTSRNFGSGVTVGAWHFIAVTYNGTLTTVTIDNTTYTSTVWNGNIDQSTGSPFTLGANLHIQTYFNGLMDEMKLFDTALTPSQISAIYTNENSGQNYDGTTRACPVCNILPVADAGADQSILSGSDVTLNGTASSDSDGSISVYTWTESGNTLGTGATPTLSNLSEGVHTITLTVTDNSGGTNSDTVDVTVIPSGACTGDSGLSGNYYNNANYTAPAVLSRVDANIDFKWGLGSPDPSIPNNYFSTKWKGSIYVPEDGNYIFSVAQDDDFKLVIGGNTLYDSTIWTQGTENFVDTNTIHLTTGSYPISINFSERTGGAYARLAWRNDAHIDERTIIPSVNFCVTSVPPVADAGPDQTISFGQSVTLDGSNSSDSDGSITDYAWSEGGTPKGAISIITLDSLSVGTHTFTLTVIDNDGGIGSDTVTVTVNPVLPCTAETPDNLVVNSCVEEGSTDWTPYGSNLSPTWVDEEGHSGIHSLKLQNNTAQKSGWRYKSLPINNRKTFTFGGWNKAENVASNALNTIDYKIEFEDGTYIYFYPPEFRFSKGTHDWEHREITHTFDKNVVNIVPYALLYYSTGTVWFDDIYVIPVDTIPSAYTQSVTMNQDTILTITLDGNDSDGDAVTFQIDTPPTHGILGNISGNQVTYTPNAGYFGEDSFTFTAHDATHASTPATVNIHINGAPIANAGPDQNITLGDTVTLDGSGSTDDNASSLTYHWTEANIPVDESSISPTLTISTAGIYTITLTVTDNNGLTSTDTVTIRVNTPPVAEDMNFTMIMDTNITFALSATDADGDTMVSYPIQSPPAHGTLSGPDANLTYTPNSGYVGTDSFTYQAYDGMDYSDTATVDFKIVEHVDAIPDDFNTTYLTPLSGNVMENDHGYETHLTNLNLTRDANLTQLCNLNQDFNGTINMSDDGNFIYYPSDRFAGNVGFYYTITDALGYTSTTYACITVYPPRNDLNITKSAPAQVDGGQAMDYTLLIQSVENEAYLPARDVIVSDTLPPGVVYNGVTAPSEWTCSEVSGTVSCAASVIATGYSATITIHTFAPQVLSTITNTAEIDSGTPDPDRTNNSSSATTDVRGLDIDLAITKTVSASEVNTTNSFSYTLNVSNLGTVAASAVSVTDTLPPALGFISIDPGTDWVCGQGSTIDCSYVANGGIFPANSTSSAITINVRAPSTTGVHTNTAEVGTTSTLEVDTSNNTSSVDVTITNGMTQNNSVALTKYIQFNIHGDYELIGNTNINFAGTDPDQPYNDRINMTYVDTASTATTYNSSSSTLNINSTENILWAGLFWEGHICGFDFEDNPSGAGTGCDWNNSAYPNYEAVTANFATSIGQVRLRAPNGSYQVISAGTLNVINQDTMSQTYSAFSDITQIVQNSGSGVYSVADIVLSEGRIGGGGNYGGWSMIVVHEDPSQTLSYKNISIFNGFQYITADNTAFNVTGFLTPRSGPISASLAFFAADGDPVNGGIIRMQNQSGVLTPLSNSANPNTNTLNSTMTVFGNNINTGVTKTYGVDADRMDVGSYMSNSQNAVGFSFDVSNPTNSNQADNYSLSMFTFATDLTTPVIDDFQKSAVIIDKDGTRRVAGPNQPIYPGSQIEYTISFKNTGDEIAEDIEVFDDFDYDGLSLALDTGHFDATKLKLFHSDTATNEVNNPDCGYLVNSRRVYCKLSTIAIDDTYTMQFVVSVKDQFDNTILENNASNTAYAKYRNPNENTYVVRGSTPAPENEPIGGKSNSLNAGVFSSPPSENGAYISVDAINKNFDYAQDRNITTKLANTAFDIQLIHRDIAGDNTGYVAYHDTNGNVRPLNVVVSLQADSVQPPLNDPATATFFDGESSILSKALAIPNAYRNTRLKMNYLDWHTILSWASANSPCLANGQTDVYFNGMPSCFNVYYYVKDLFPKASFPQIADCYGEGTASIPSGFTYACDSRAYTLQGEAVGNIYPKVYKHSFGCFQCVSDGFLNFRNASTDNFAVRPVAFDLNSSAPQFPDLLRSGIDYNLSLVAKDGLGKPTMDYNTSKNTLRVSGVLRYLPNGQPDGANALEGDFNLSTAATDFNISNGVSTTSNTADGVPEEVLPVSYNNVGKINAGIEDPNWAFVDTDDTPLMDCNTSGAPYSLGDGDIEIEASRNICSNDLNITFIPHHFDIAASLSKHRADSNTTYLSNDLNMSAHVEVTLSAMNAKGGITTNFKKGFYEQAMTVDLNVTDWNTTLLAASPLHKDADGNRLDTNIQIKDIATAALLGFGSLNGDANGTRKILAKDGNLTQRLLFNYHRNIDSPKNPFVIQGSDVNISVGARYTGTALEGTADINGTGLADQNATFYYARIRPAQAFYPKVAANTKQTPVLIDIYCDLGYVACANRGINTIDGESSEHDWWLSLDHNMSGEDGNITLSVDTTGGTLNKTILDINGAEQDDTPAEDTNVIVGRDTAPLTVGIDIDTTNVTDTSSWLIHNPDAIDPNALFKPPAPLFSVEFIGGSSWSGHGATGNVVDSNASKRKNNRLGW